MQGGRREKKEKKKFSTLTRRDTYAIPSHDESCSLRTTSFYNYSLFLLYVLLIARDNEPMSKLSSTQLAPCVLADSVGGTLNDIIINWSVAIGPYYVRP